MSFQKRGFRDLYQSLETDLRRRAPELTDWEEGSVVRSLFESFAYEMATLYEQMDLVYQAGFVDTATGPNLDRVVAVLGITRNEPDFATGEVTFERDPGSTAEITIPVDTLVTTVEDPEQRPSKKTYRTIAEARLRAGETTVDVKVQAEERGPELTADSETVVVMPRPVPGVKAVHNRKPIRFLGREREGDEDLRDRAKKALLASGRASATSIENALLGLPGVRGVRVRQDFGTEVRPPDGPPVADPWPPEGDRLGRGVVKVYVDGLKSDNAARLRDRVDEVRAAGVFVILEPAVALNTRATLLVEADPRVRGEEERAVLERQVRDAVIRFLDRQRMGQPLLVSQLTREVLDVRGVQDLADFRLVTFRDGGVAAAGTVTLTRSAEDAATNLSIPALTELRTITGQRFVTAGDTPVAAGKTSVEVEVRSLLLGREGEMLRTGSAVAWDDVRIGGTAFRVRNADPIRLASGAYGSDTKRLEASVEERFVPDLIRVALTRTKEDGSQDPRPKTLAVQVQVHVAAPADTGRDALLTSIRTAITNAGKTARPDDAWAAGLDDAAKKEAAAAVDSFFAGVRDQATALRAALTADLDPALREALSAEVEAYFAGARASEPVRIEEGVLRDRLRAVLETRLTAAEVERLLAASLTRALAPLLATPADAFPSATVERTIRAALERAAQAKIDAEEAKVTAARDALTAASDALRLRATELSKLAANDPNRTAKQAEVDAAQALVNQRQTELDAATRKLDTVRTSATRTLADEQAKVPARVDTLRDRALAALATLGSEPSRAAMAGGTAAKGAFTLGVRLRTESFEGVVRPDAPFVEPDFVETPVAETVFVYTRLVELAGTLTLGMPLTATDEEKRTVRAQVRQAVADWLDSLRPEENVELDRVRALAEAHEKVLRASFDLSPALRGRLEGATLSVGALEKAALSPGDFVIGG